MAHNADETIDCSGLYCPQPVINAQRALESMAAGQVLEIRATDPGVESDFPLFCRSRKLTLLGVEKRDGEYVILIRK